MKINKVTALKIAAIAVLSVIIIAESAAVVVKRASDSTGEDATVTEEAAYTEEQETQEETAEYSETEPERTKIVVLDPGHGKASSLMTDEEKAEYGWKKNTNGQWGEWRHYKIGSGTIDCEGGGCNGRVTPNGACWYPIGNGDRETEPDINLRNTLAAKKYLERLGYVVRLTRSTNDENPSITRRLEYCFPDMDRNQAPDADIFVCIHSNAGGGRGTAYIKAEGPYDQKWIKSDYVEKSNHIGELCNDYIISNTSLSANGSGVIGFEPELIAFCKSPVPCGYLEIGFFDNSADRAILESESDDIGRGIALGIDAYFKGL